MDLFIFIFFFVGLHSAVAHGVWLIFEQALEIMFYVFSPSFGLHWLSLQGLPLEE